MRITRIILSLLMTIFLLLLPCLLLIDHAVPVFGYSFHVVNTGSMEPTLRVGDAAIVWRCKPEDVQPGDVILYAYYPPIAIPSRVQRIIAEQNGAQGFWFDVRADWSDPPEPAIISGQDLIGKVTGRLPGLGRAVRFMQSPLGTYMTFLVCFAAALTIILPAVRARRKKALS